MTANDCCPGLANNWPTELQFKLTVYLQGCLAYKPCSASGLNCKYLKPYIKLKLIGLLSYQTIPKFLRQNELSNSSRLLNASARITFWTLHVRANFVFRLFYVSLSFRVQSAKTTCVRFAIFIFSEKLQNIFEKGFKKHGVFVQKSLILKKYYPAKTAVLLRSRSEWQERKKIPRHLFVVYVLIYPLSKFGVIGQIPYEFELSASTEKIDLRKQR